MQILIVEDDRRLARQLKKGLDELGHAATTTFDGPEGLTAAEAGEFDVIVLDVMLPGLDGLSVVRRFRGHGGDTPILLLTARDTPEDIIGGLDAGADDYLTKPFSFKILEARLRALARRKRVEPRTRLKTVSLPGLPCAPACTMPRTKLWKTVSEASRISWSVRSPRYRSPKSATNFENTRCSAQGGICSR
jgi:DNA-binding response OmpR family regulator